VLAVCADEEVIGAPFYDGAGRRRCDRRERAAGTDSPAGAGASASSDRCARRDPSVDWRAAGLEDFGKPTGYLERQPRRFNGLWELNKTREIDAVESVGAWLAENLPSSARRWSSTGTSARATRSSPHGHPPIWSGARPGDGDDATWRTLAACA
jgi:aminoglycoside phosphotransferase (APT) family kinase protein